VLDHWNNSQGLNMLLNSNTLPRFWFPLWYLQTPLLEVAA